MVHTSSESLSHIHPTTTAVGGRDIGVGSGKGYGCFIGYHALCLLVLIMHGNVGIRMTDQVERINLRLALKWMCCGRDTLAVLGVLGRHFGAEEGWLSSVQPCSLHIDARSTSSHVDPLGL